jgi:hypothetical protein
LEIALISYPKALGHSTYKMERLSPSIFSSPFDYAVRKGERCPGSNLVRHPNN